MLDFAVRRMCPSPTNHHVVGWGCVAQHGAGVLPYRVCEKVAPCQRMMLADLRDACWQ